jgi:3-deoxy-D-manno-octulosonic-acid transferase
MGTAGNTKIFFEISYEYLIAPLMRIGFHLGALIQPKIREGVRLRRDINGRAPWALGPGNTNPIWIHCASGEFEYAKPVIEKIKAHAPGQKILVTYFSPSVAAAVAKFPLVDFHSPSPWESRASVQELLQHHRPRALLLARTDTWPIMLRECSRANIPTLLFSATLPASAGRMHPLMRSFSQWVFSFLNEVFVVTEEDKRNFELLGLTTPIRVAGDTRFDQVIKRLSQPKPLKEIFPSNRNILVAGSSWEADETVLVPLVEKLQTNLKFIIAPHEPTMDHLDSLQKQLVARGILSVRYSEASAWPENVPVLLIDQMGILAEIYAKARFAFVGGSFKKTVHSVMEPLGAGCITFVGPLHQNNREALEFKTIQLPGKTGLAAVCEVVDVDDFARKLLQASSAGVVEQDFIKNEVLRRSGRSDEVARWALQL